MSIQHTDFAVAEAVKTVLEEFKPKKLRAKIHNRRNIPGLRGKRISRELREGVWIKSLGQRPGKTFSSVQDRTKRTLVLFVHGGSKTQVTEETLHDLFRRDIINYFHSQRSTGLEGELYSYVQIPSDYDIDDSFSRDRNVDIFIINTRFREDRR